MPNWISGTLKVRGTYDDVKKFYTEGVKRVEPEWNKKERDMLYVEIPKDEWMEVHEYGETGKRECSITLKNGGDYGDWTYVKDTRRAFISSDIIEFYEDGCNETVIGISRINQAWGFAEEDWVDISNNYNVDIRLFGLECGMQFGEELEIINSKTTMYKTITYDDWDWECPFPDMGG